MYICSRTAGADGSLVLESGFPVYLFVFHTQSLEIDYSITIRAISMKLPDNTN